MTAFSAYLENALLGATLLGSPFTALNTVFLSLATSLASDGSSYTEVTTNIGYERLTMATGVDWSDVTSTPDTTVVNSTTKTFSPATTPWGTITHFAIFDSATIGGGNMLYWGALTSSQVVNTDTVFEVAAGDLTIRLD